MASFISTLSLFLLVLAHGYLSFPLNNALLQTSTMLSSDLEVTSERPLVPRGLSMNRVQQTTEVPMDFEMTSSSENLPESASREPRVLHEMTTLSPLKFTTDDSKADKRGLNDLSLTTVESSTGEDDDVTTEDDATIESESEPSSNKREVSLDLTTNSSPLTSTSSDLTSEVGRLQSTTNSLVDAEWTTEKSSSSKPSKKFTGSLKDQRNKEEDLDQDKKEKHDEEEAPAKPSKTYKKEKEDDKDKSGEDSKKSAAPVAQLDLEGLKNVGNYQKEYMDLDENSAFTVTQSGSTVPTATRKYKKGKKPLNEGEESATTKEEESN